MALVVKVVVHLSESPKVQESVRRVIKASGVEIREFAIQESGQGGKELYAELRLNDRVGLGRLMSNIEAVKGAAVMAATEPKEIPSAKKAGR